MSAKNDGGPAFPGANLYDGKPDYRTSGMSLRDWIAGKCAAAIMTKATGLGEVTKEQRAAAFSVAATVCYEMADAMLVERAK